MSGGTYWFDKHMILDAARRGLEEGLEEAGDRVAADAKRRAPIRKAFKEGKGFRRKFRALSDNEKDIAIKRAEAYYANDEFKRRRAVGFIKSYAKVQIARRGSANSIGRSSGHRLLGYENRGRFQSTSGAFKNRKGGYEPGEQLRPKLTARGAYEIRSGRAIHKVSSPGGAHTQVRVGGALKASIGNIGVHETANGYATTVSADIGYAKYVEFPTIRTAAQPFLLPALASERGRLVSTVAKSIRKNLGG